VSRNFLSAVCLLAVSSAVLAGPKPPTTSSFAPEIGYTYASGNYKDLRLANRAGDKAILVHRTSYGSSLTFDLSDEGTKRIAYQDAGRLFIRTWSVTTSAVSVSNPVAIPLPIGRAERMDFSPDGGKLAVSYIATPEFRDQGGLNVVDLNRVDDPATPADERVLPVLSNWHVFRVRWSAADPGNIYFWGAPYSSGRPASFYKVSETGATPPVEVVLELTGADFDMGRPSASGPVMIVSAGSSAVVYNDFAGFYPAFTVGQTALAHFNCKNDAVIGRDYRTRREAISITTLSPRSTVVWSSDTAIHETDWLQRVPCV
jgi:hypothetical protein